MGVVNQSVFITPNVFVQENGNTKVHGSLLAHGLALRRIRAVLCSDSLSAQLHRIMNSSNIVSALKSVQRASSQACFKTLKELRTAH